MSTYFISGDFVGNISSKKLHYDLFMEYFTEIDNHYNFRKAIEDRVRRLNSVKENSVIEINNIVRL